jgi:hypothetical protein
VSRSRKMLWALAILVVGFIGYSSLPDAGELLSGATAKEQATAVLRDQLAVADAALTDEEAFLFELEQARVAVPRSPDLPAVIDVLEETVRRSGMRWTSGAPSGQESSPDVSQDSWQISMTVSGTAQQVPALLDAIRGLDRLVVVDSVQVRSDGAGVIAQISARFFALQGEPLAFESAPGETSASSPEESGENASTGER